MKSTALRVVQLYLGLVCYAASMDLMVRAGLGLDAWDVLHQGLSKQFGLSMGVIAIIVGAIVLLGWIPLRERPGFGTISNVFVVGLAFDAILPHVPVPHMMIFKIVMTLAGIALCGLATGMYITVGYGAGPRDGLMTGIARRTGWSVRLTRTGIEVSVLAVGWIIGGTVGIGTVAFAVLIGPLSQFSLRMFSRSPAARWTPPASIAKAGRPSDPATDLAVGQPAAGATAAA